MISLNIDGYFYNLPIDSQAEAQLQHFVKQLTTYLSHMKASFPESDSRHHLLLSALMLLKEKENSLSQAAQNKVIKRLSSLAARVKELEAKLPAKSANERQLA